MLILKSLTSDWPSITSPVPWTLRLGRPSPTAEMSILFTGDELVTNVWSSVVRCVFVTSKLLIQICPDVW